MKISRTTPSELTGIQPIEVIMEDIQIHVGRTGKASVGSLTTRGLNWIKNNMTQEAPITVDAEAVEDIKKLIEADGLSVIIR